MVRLDFTCQHTKSGRVSCSWWQVSTQVLHVDDMAYLNSVMTSSTSITSNGKSTFCNWQISEDLQTNPCPFKNNEASVKTLGNHISTAYFICMHIMHSLYAYKPFRLNMNPIVYWYMYTTLCFVAKYFLELSTQTHIIDNVFQDNTQ